MQRGFYIQTIFKLDSKGYHCHSDLSAEFEISLHSLRSGLFSLDWANFFMDENGFLIISGILCTNIPEVLFGLTFSLTPNLSMALF